MAADTDRIGQKKWGSGAEVLVHAVERRLIMGREVIDDFDTPAVGVLMTGGRGGIKGGLDERIAIVAVDGKTVGVKNRVKAAVAGFEIKGASVGLEREL